MADPMRSTTHGVTTGNVLPTYRHRAALRPDGGSFASRGSSGDHLHRLTRTGTSDPPPRTRVDRLTPRRRDHREAARLATARAPQARPRDCTHSRDDRPPT